MVSKTDEQAKQIIKKFKEMKELEKERNILRKKEREMNIKVCRMQNEINDIVESDTRRF